LQDLHAAMNLANQSFEATAEQYRALAQRRISKEDLRAYVKIVLGVDKEADAVLSARMLHRIDQIEENMLLGAGAGLAGMTYWGAYNAVTEHLSYQAGRGPNTRLDSLWFGANQTVNQRALDTAMQMALGA
ncbi:MAG: DUF932 domain-containing protein, partial [Anaerolineales bacterium]